MPITKLHFTNVGPFEDIEFEFDQQVNVFTGPNNSGKSTALAVLGEIAVFPFSMPHKLLRNEDSKWSLEVVFDTAPQSYSGKLPIDLESLDSIVKLILDGLGYSTFIPALRRNTGFRSNGPSVQLGVPNWYQQQIETHLNENPGVLNNISKEIFVRNAMDDLGAELVKRGAIFEPDAAMISDEGIVQKIVDWDYQSYRRQQPAARDIVQWVGTMASEITEGFPIEFKGVGEDQRGLFPQFGTLDGDVPLDVLSQGTQSMIQWLAQLLIGYAEFYDYPVDLAEKPGILIIDEIDAHLHPSWQRRIIPALTNHFPNLQIFCSTHSPLMLAGLKEGQVHLLRRDENRKVFVSKNDTDIIGWSADEILRNFMDVRSPTDIETVKHLERLQALRQKDALSEEEAKELEHLRHQVN